MICKPTSCMRLYAVYTNKSVIIGSLIAERHVNRAHHAKDLRHTRGGG